MRTTPVPRFLTALVAVTRRFLDDQGFLLAAALSFSFLLCLAPLTLLLFSAAGFILESNAIAEYVLDSASYLLPGYGHEVLQVVALLTRERGVTSVLGAAGLMIFASQLFSLMRIVMNTAFRVSKRADSFTDSPSTCLRSGSLRWRLRSEVRRLAARLKTPESALSPRPGPPEQKTPGA